MHLNLERAEEGGEKERERGRTRGALYECDKKIDSSVVPGPV